MNYETDQYITSLWSNFSEDDIQALKKINEEWKDSDRDYDNTPEEIHKKRREKQRNAFALGTDVEAKWGNTWYDAKVNEIKRKNGKLIGYDVRFTVDNTLYMVAPGKDNIKHKTL